MGCAVCPFYRTITDMTYVTFLSRLADEKLAAKIDRFPDLAIA